MILAYNMATPKCNLLFPYSSCGENVLLYIRVALEFAKARNEFMLAALRLQRVEEGSPVSLCGPFFVYKNCFRIYEDERRSHVGSVAALIRCACNGCSPIDG